MTAAVAERVSAIQHDDQARALIGANGYGDGDGYGDGYGDGDGYGW